MRIRIAILLMLGIALLAGCAPAEAAVIEEPLKPVKIEEVETRKVGLSGRIRLVCVDGTKYVWFQSPDGTTAIPHVSPSDDSITGVSVNSCDTRGEKD